jgi:hypothetical protein
MKIKTWHKETLIVGIILFLTTLLFSNNLINWVTTLAILITFNHAQIGDRLQERQDILSSKTVECYWKLNKLFALKEILWIVAFLMMDNYAAIVGSVLFFIYPFWRKFYRKNIKPLNHG